MNECKLCGAGYKGDRCSECGQAAPERRPGEGKPQTRKPNYPAFIRGIETKGGEE